MLIRRTITAIAVAACMMFLLPTAASANGRSSDSRQSDKSDNSSRNDNDSRESGRDGRHSSVQSNNSGRSDKSSDDPNHSKHKHKDNQPPMSTTTTIDPTQLTCVSGDIAPGNYSWIVVTGNCAIPSGVVNVDGKVTVKAGAVLDASSAGVLNVDKGIRVGKNAILNLGSSATADVIKGGIWANHATAVVLHFDTVRGGIHINGGGSGVNCDVNTDLGAPPYFDVEDSHVRGDVSITNLKACWLGFIRNNVRGTVKIKNNTLADPDATEIVTNTIKGNLRCSGNSPAAQVGDSTGAPNQVTGHKTGECKNV